jgi:hypothetical protein
MLSILSNVRRAKFVWGLVVLSLWALNGDVCNGDVCNGDVCNGDVCNGDVCNGDVCNGQGQQLKKTQVVRCGCRRLIVDGLECFVNPY